jgi:ferric-dicitrate binding protein FerR (iron transport regulator)
MTSRLSDRAYARALAALTREASEAPVPELDWDRIEANVLSGTASAISPDNPVAPPAPAVRRIPSSPTWSSTPWPMALAAAAAAALIYGSGATRGPSHGQTSIGTAAPRSAVAHWSSLEVGQVAETDARSAVYHRPGVVSFALAPNSRIEVVGNDLETTRTGGITVALSRGSIHAEVTPRTEGEVFAVEVERTRIAVHGTSFTVTRDGDRVTVDVAHGSVAVGPVGHAGSTHGWLVVGPDRATFSLDGGRHATWLPPSAELAPAPVEPAVEVATTAVVGAPALRPKRAAALPASSSRADLAANATKGEISAAIAAPKAAWGEGAPANGRDAMEYEGSEITAIQRKLEACYEKQVSAFGVRFSVESSLELTILPNGAIREGVFTPPLSPTLMSCADKAIGAAHFPGGDAPRKIHIPVQLSPR